MRETAGGPLRKHAVPARFRAAGSIAVVKGRAKASFKRVRTGLEPVPDCLFVFTCKIADLLLISSKR